MKNLKTLVLATTLTLSSAVFAWGQKSGTIGTDWGGNTTYTDYNSGTKTTFQKNFGGGYDVYQAPANGNGYGYDRYNKRNSNSGYKNSCYGGFGCK